ncbi:MAG: ester cyclase [Bacteroidetes bacterium]|nr:ester cyclase [Bacteroidota bacterium]
MKKILFSAITGLLLFFISCSDKEDDNGDSGKAKKNIESLQAVAKAFETGDVGKIDEVVAADFVDHTDRGDIGRDSLKAMITMMHKAMPDLKFNTVKELADDDYAAVWYKLTGTSDGSMGMPKGPFEMNTIDMVRFKDGKAVEHWSFGEMRDVMKTMSGMAQPQPATEQK